MCSGQGLDLRLPNYNMMMVDGEFLQLDAIYMDLEVPDDCLVHVGWGLDRVYCLEAHVCAF